MEEIVPISIHSLVKRETSGDDDEEPSFVISIHSLVKRETERGWQEWMDDLISIHSLVKRETLSPTIEGVNIVNFNPLPRKEGDVALITILSGACSISIHSLVKRETSFNRFSYNFQSISIHSLVKRETRGTKYRRYAPYHFNPLPRKEGDPEPLRKAIDLLQFQSTPS